MSQHQRWLVSYGKLPEKVMPSTEPVVDAVYKKLDGHSALRTSVESEADLSRAGSHRIPSTALARVQRHGLFSESAIRHFIIPVRTRRHRQEKRHRLTVEESDRMTRIQALAEDVFGDPQKANR